MSTNSQPPVATLSRTQLTAALVLVTLIPFGLVVLLYLSMPDIQDPVLQAEVSIGPRAWQGEKEAETRIVPSIVLRNPTQDVWGEVNMSINDQFHFKHPDEIGPGQEISVPLKFFHTKGNAYYPPESQTLESITVYAQIPSGARAILKIEDESLDRALRPGN